MSVQALLQVADDVADRFLRYWKHWAPTATRLCLVSTFLEDAYRMFDQWHEQKYYISKTQHCSLQVATFFVAVNLFGQLAGCFMILRKVHVPAACAVLFSIMVLQTLAYKNMWDFTYFSRSWALTGALLLLLAESREERKSLFAGVPSLRDNKPKTYLQLIGRVLLALMFATALRLNLSVMAIIQDIINTTLMGLVTVGYKTKLSALLLVILLFGQNLYINNWWVLPSYLPIRDSVRYDFFQVMSVIGGLLMVVLLGPGGVSMDEHKKLW